MPQTKVIDVDQLNNLSQTELIGLVASLQEAYQESVFEQYWFQQLVFQLGLETAPFDLQREEVITYINKLLD